MAINRYLLDTEILRASDLSTSIPHTVYGLFALLPTAMRKIALIPVA